MTSGPFRIAVSGSRTITDRAAVYTILDEESTTYLMLGYDPIILHLGDARGVDHSALMWARERGIERVIFFADRKGFSAWTDSHSLISESPELESAFLASSWDDRGDGDGKDAGRIRNYAMIGGMDDDRGKSPRADLLVAIYPAEILGEDFTVSGGVTPGTRNAKATARTCGVFIHSREVGAE